MPVLEHMRAGAARYRALLSIPGARAPGIVVGTAAGNALGGAIVESRSYEAAVLAAATAAALGAASVLARRATLVPG